MLGGMKSPPTMLGGAPDLHSGTPIMHARGVLHSERTRRPGRPRIHCETVCGSSASRARARPRTRRTSCWRGSARATGMTSSPRSASPNERGPGQASSSGHQRGVLDRRWPRPPRILGSRARRSPAVRPVRHRRRDPPGRRHGRIGARYYRQVADNDLWIVATALAYELPIATADQQFGTVARVFEIELLAA